MGRAKTFFFRPSFIFWAIRLVLLYVFRTIVTPVFSGHFVTPR